jgi:hypothetical protein
MSPRILFYGGQIRVNASNIDGLCDYPDTPSALP